MRSWCGSFLLALAITACGGMTSDPPTQGPVAPGQACPEPGATSPADDGCNTCTCEEAGWSCTELACPEPACEPGDIMNDRCNSCSCSSSGEWVCDTSFCEPTCNEGDVMPNGCHECVCSGGEWACDDGPCIALCQDGSVKAAGDGCNTCSCVEGAWACTDLPCPEPQCPIPDDLPDQTCSGNELFGRAIGTDACCALCYSLPEDYVYYESLEACEASKVCTQGDTKYADDECNTCTCTVDEEWVCTAADCEPVYCGGFAGGTCTEDEYCAYMPNEGGCGVGDASAICRPRPEACDDYYEPVCGCDGETYSNACYAQMQGDWGIMTDGPCEAPPPN